MADRPCSERLAVRRRVRGALLKVRVNVLQTLIVCGRGAVPVPAEAAAEKGEESGGWPDGAAPHLLHGGPDGPLDEDPGEAGHAEQHGDGQEDVGDEA